MNVAIIHYHLNRGGVMQVIANHLQAMDVALAGNGPLRVALVYGGRREGWPDRLPRQLQSLDVSLCEVPGLDYDQGDAARPERLHGDIKAALTRMGFSGHETLLHVHNHALGKNLSLPGALGALAGDGYRMLLQIHDFAEDLRPIEYGRLRWALAPDDPSALSAALYPQASGIHYAVLNRRDESILQQAGFDPARVHLLPNPISSPAELPDGGRARSRINELFDIAPEHRWVLYPVRGIARKNVGEMLLWSAVLGDRATFGITLPPLNPLQKTAYDDWKRTAKRLQLPCVFEVGTDGGLTFAENLAAADMILSTSLAEGFGMTFLESWLAGRYLIGRDLPDITADFALAGLRLDSLRPRIEVPIQWIGRGEFRGAFTDSYCRVLDTFGRPHPGGPQWQQAWDTLEQDGLVDFGSLTREHQRTVVQRVRESTGDANHLLELNGWMAEALTADCREREEVIAANAAIVGEQFSLAASGRRIVKLYEDMLIEEPRTAVEAPSRPEAILDAFVHPARFRPVRILE